MRLLGTECSPENGPEGTGDSRAQQTQLGQEQDARLQLGHEKNGSGYEMYRSF